MFLQNKNMHKKFQSGFRKGHSTDTALVKVINDLRVSADNKNVCVLLLLDLTGAVDMIDHSILMSGVLRRSVWISPVLVFFLPNKQKLFCKPS